MKFLSAVKSAVSVIAAPIGFREILLFAGAALLAIGLWPLSPPAALAVPGAILVYVAIFGTP